jgi:hypothetical protein
MKEDIIEAFLVLSAKQRYSYGPYFVAVDDYPIAEWVQTRTDG